MEKLLSGWSQLLPFAVFMQAFSIGLFPPRRDKVVIYQMAMGVGKEKRGTKAEISKQ